MKICEVDWSNLCLQQFGKFSYMQRMQSPETEIMHKCRSAGINLEKIREITSGNLFLVGFSHLQPLCGSGNINTGKSKVFSRSSSSAGVLSKQPQTSLKSSDSNASTSTSKSQPPHGSSSASRGHNSSATSSSGQPQ